MNPVIIDVKITVKDKWKVFWEQHQGVPNLNWEEGNISGYTANLVLLTVRIQFYPVVLYLFI